MRNVLLQNQEKKAPNLFKDIKNRSIRTRNQATIMANLFEDNINKKRGVSSSGAATIMHYFTQVDNEDKDTVFKQYKEIMLERGFEEVA